MNVIEATIISPFDASAVRSSGYRTVTFVFFLSTEGALIHSPWRDVFIKPAVLVHL
jgi:hypothetical protein